MPFVVSGLVFSQTVEYDNLNNSNKLNTILYKYYTDLIQLQTGKLPTIVSFVPSSLYHSFPLPTPHISGRTALALPVSAGDKIGTDTI